MRTKAKRKGNAGQPTRPLVAMSPKWSQRHRATAEELAAELNRPVCGAYTRAGALCRNRPDPSRTNGRCRMHGARAGRPLKHGRYSKYARVNYDAPNIPGARFNTDAVWIEEEINAVRSEIRKLLRKPKMALVDIDDDEQWADVITQDTKLRALLERAAQLVRERNKIMPGYFLPINVVSQMIECREAIFISAVEKAVDDKEVVENIRTDYRRATRPFKSALFKELDSFRFAEAAKRASKLERADYYRRLVETLAPGEWQRLRRMAREAREQGEETDGDEEVGDQW